LEAGQERGHLVALDRPVRVEGRGGAAADDPGVRQAVDGVAGARAEGGEVGKPGVGRIQLQPGVVGRDPGDELRHLSTRHQLRRRERGCGDPGGDPVAAQAVDLQSERARGGVGEAGVRDRSGGHANCRTSCAGAGAALGDGTTAPAVPEPTLTQASTAHTPDEQTSNSQALLG
jgi:hypothetical protein